MLRTFKKQLFYILNYTRIERIARRYSSDKQREDNRISSTCIKPFLQTPNMSTKQKEWTRRRIRLVFVKKAGSDGLAPPTFASDSPSIISKPFTLSVRTNKFLGRTCTCITKRFKVARAFVIKATRKT